MKKTKRAALEARGWRLGSAAEFLGLSRAEAAFVETKLALSRSLRDRRTAEGLSQTALAKRLRSSQSRIAKMEAADPTVSVDLLLRALFALGARPRDVASSLTKRPTAAAHPCHGTLDSLSAAALREHGLAKEGAAPRCPLTPSLTEAPRAHGGPHGPHVRAHGTRRGT